MARQLDFYFDCSSPWTYLAFHAIQPLAAEVGAEIVWKPILVGGVFNAVNQTVYENRSNPNPRKQAYMLQDLAAWANLYDIKITFPPKVFPVNSVKCMRGAFVALDEGKPSVVPYESCAPASCEVRAKLGADFIELMRAAGKTRSTVTLKGGDTRTYDFGHDGLQAGLARLASAKPQ